MESPADEDLSAHARRARREEAVRRASLYGISSKSRQPTVHIPPVDARTRKELQILFAPQPTQPSGTTLNGLSIYEDELEQRKRHDTLSRRPPLDQSHPLRDLYTTVPRQIHIVEKQDDETGLGGAVASARHPREWRVGYKNDPQSDFHGIGMRGVFEPTDSLREKLIRSQTYTQSTTALAYPQPFTSDQQVVESLDPYDADQARKQMEDKLHAGMLLESEPSGSPSRAKRHWCPASLGPPKRKSAAAKTVKTRTPAMSQPFPVRAVGCPLQKIGLFTKEKEIHKQQLRAHETNALYEQIHHHATQLKDPTVRYSLPVENQHFERAYRLGLDPVLSSSEPLDDAPSSPSGRTTTEATKLKPKPKPKGHANQNQNQTIPKLFRPKSAVSLQMDTTLSSSPSCSLSRSSSSVSLLTRTSSSSSKVAGARRRPHSATLSYLSHSTVYCMEPATGSNCSSTASQKATSSFLTGAGVDGTNAHEILLQQKQYGADFLSVILQERAKRRDRQPQMLQELAQRGVLHSIPIPQIFARLRREALKNLTKRVEYTRYEKLPLEEYMSLCGLAVVPGTPPKHEELLLLDGQEEDDGDDDIEQQPASPVDHHQDDEDEDEDPVLQALADHAELRQLPYDTPAVPSSGFRKRAPALRPDPVDGNNSSTVLALRRALFVTRETFHIAMEAFALTPRDVNLLFSCLDLHVDDCVQVWAVICLVETLQDGHEELRRSRVEIKAGRHLPKELNALRRSITIPHRNHVALPVGSLS